MGLWVFLCPSMGKLCAWERKCPDLNPKVWQREMNIGMDQAKSWSCGGHPWVIKPVDEGLFIGKPNLGKLQRGFCGWRA